MTKSIASSAADAALGHILARATAITLCAGAPDNATEASTAVSAGGRMLADLSLIGNANADFAISTTAEGGRRLTVASRTEIIGREDGSADHLAILDASGGDVLILTELTEPQPILNGALIATRSFSVTLNNP